MITLECPHCGREFYGFDLAAARRSLARHRPNKSANCRDCERLRGLGVPAWRLGLAPEPVDLAKVKAC